MTTDGRSKRDEIGIPSACSHTGRGKDVVQFTQEIRQSEFRRANLELS